jgi:hypothetical protein
MIYHAITITNCRHSHCHHEPCHQPLIHHDHQTHYSPDNLNDCQLFNPLEKHILLPLRKFLLLLAGLRTRQASILGFSPKAFASAYEDLYSP